MPHFDKLRVMLLEIGTAKNVNSLKGPDLVLDLSIGEDRCRKTEREMYLMSPANYLYRTWHKPSDIAE